MTTAKNQTRVAAVRTEPYWYALYLGIHQGAPTNGSNRDLNVVIEARHRSFIAAVCSHSRGMLLSHVLF